MNLEAMHALYKAVKAGRIIQAIDAVDEFLVSHDDRHLIWLDVCKASQNDMNAALALMPAVLPDALVSSMDQDSRRRWYVTLTDIRGKFLAHDGADTLARALTLAILAAMIAIEERKK